MVVCCCGRHALVAWTWKWIDIVWVMTMEAWMNVLGWVVHGIMAWLEILALLLLLCVCILWI